MSFTSIVFIGFLPLILLFYWNLSPKFRPALLLIVSYGFYIYWNTWMVVLLLFVTVVSYVAGRSIGKIPSKKGKKQVLIWTVVICLGMLFFFKYLGFFGENLWGLFRLFGYEGAPFVISVLLPVGISFYTFQAMSYVMDVYRGQVEAEENPFIYALFVSFFPQLVAGPIERVGDLLPQLKKQAKWSFDQCSQGLYKMLQGYFKKFVIADFVAPYVNQIFSDVSQANGPMAVLSGVLFALQIYCDFSGYSDIAIGTARMLGIRLTENFEQPYGAESIRQFWRRWHLSLTRWFTDYVYIPLGGNRRGNVRTYVNILLVFLLSGLWHGAAWTYVLWGGLHGVYLVCGRIWDQRKKEKSAKSPSAHGVVHGLRVFRTFLLVCFAWIFFRAATVEDGFVLVSHLFTDWSLDGLLFAWNQCSFTVVSVLHILFGVLCLYFFPKVSYEKQTSEVRGFLIFLFVLLTVFAWLTLLAANVPSTFIYFQF